MKKFLILLISTVTVIGLNSCGNKPADAVNTESPANPKEEVIQPVKIMPVEKTIIKRTVKISASLVAEEETYLAPSIPGKVSSIKVDVNDKVSQGEVLVEMDKSQLIQTQLQYESLKKDYDRMDTLLKFGSVTQQAFDQIKTQLNVTGTALENLRENTVLKAPYNGIVTGKYYSDGEVYAGAPNTQAGKAAIVSLVKMDLLKVYINLSESYLPLVKEGLVAKVVTDVYPSESLQAKVFRIYPTINAATRTFTVELRMKNPEYKLRPGMYGEVTLELGDREALLVPAISVVRQTGTNNRYIFLYENGTCKKVMVEIGERLDDQLELIPNGVRDGDKLIYAGQVNLMDGDKVKVVNE